MVDPAIYFLQGSRDFSMFPFQGSGEGRGGRRVYVLSLYKLNFCFLAKPLFDTHTYLRNIPFN